jgi:hypothetical protein
VTVLSQAVLARRDAECAPETAAQVALVGEPGFCCDCSDGCAAPRAKHHQRPVTAPSEAEETSLQYFAKTPVL